MMIRVGLVFNEQTANNISVMDPKAQSLVEYHIPSKNPNWGDCDSGTQSFRELWYCTNL